MYVLIFNKNYLTSLAHEYIKDNAYKLEGLKHPYGVIKIGFYVEIQYSL